MSSRTESNGFYERFDGDRYERLSRGVEVLALDPVVCDAPMPFNDVGLEGLVAAITRCRLLDHLSDPNANMVTALFLVDFLGGAHQVGARIQQMLAAGKSDESLTYDTLAVVSGLAAVLALMVDTVAWLPATTGD